MDWKKAGMLLMPSILLTSLLLILISSFFGGVIDKSNSAILGWFFFLVCSFELIFLLIYYILQPLPKELINNANDVMETTSTSNVEEFIEEDTSESFVIGSDTEEVDLNIPSEDTDTGVFIIESDPKDIPIVEDTPKSDLVIKKSKKVKKKKDLSQKTKPVKPSKKLKEKNTSGFKSPMVNKLFNENVVELENVKALKKFIQDKERMYSQYDATLLTDKKYLKIYDGIEPIPLKVAERFILLFEIY